MLKRLLLSLILLIVLLPIGCTASDPLPDNLYVNGDMSANSITARVEGYSVDIIQASDLDIALNDTLMLTFPFEPSIIVVDYSSRVRHSTTYESGHSVGHSIILITGVDTITYNTNMTALIDQGGTIGSIGVQNDTADVIIAYGGYDGATDSHIHGVGTWTSGNHTLTLTFSTVANTQTAFNFVEMTATAYR